MVWQRFDKQDCSVRILHPQRYSDALWRVLARLEGFLQCCVGCNAYLTPPGSQVGCVGIVRSRQCTGAAGLVEECECCKCMLVSHMLYVGITHS